MRMPKVVRLALATVCGGFILLASAAGTSAQPSSEQVVFSGVASLNSTFALGSPAGFWIWCESESSNPYEGNCAGAMYFYALGITKGVSGDDAITEHADGTYTMTVQSSDGSVNCSLTNFLPVRQGPANRVDVACSTPAGTATSPNAVVNVTGP
jgi:hypothetical protein